MEELLQWMEYIEDVGCSPAALWEMAGIYKKAKEKARSQIETREYYQTEDIRWLVQKKDWKGLKSIGMERKNIEKNGRKTIECRYFISSLKGGIETLSRAVRGHWGIEGMHWHLDVTFQEDANINEEKTVFNKSVTNQIFGRSTGFKKIAVTGIWRIKPSCVCHAQAWESLDFLYAECYNQKSSDS